MLQRSPTKKRWPVFLLVAYAALLVLGTHFPVDSVPSFVSLQDKLVHAGAYGGLAFIAFLAATSRDWFPAGVASSVVASGLVVILATAAFGAVDETTQYFVPGRIVDALDWVANLVGCTIGAVVFGWLLSRKGLVGAG